MPGGGRRSCFLRRRPQPRHITRGGGRRPRSLETGWPPPCRTMIDGGGRACFPPAASAATQHRARQRPLYVSPATAAAAVTHHARRRPSFCHLTSRGGCCKCSLRAELQPQCSTIRGGGCPTCFVLAAVAAVPHHARPRPPYVLPDVSGRRTATPSEAAAAVLVAYGCAFDWRSLLPATVTYRSRTPRGDPLVPTWWRQPAATASFRNPFQVRADVRKACTDIAPTPQRYSVAAPCPPQRLALARHTA